MQDEIFFSHHSSCTLWYYYFYFRIWTFPPPLHTTDNSKQLSGGSNMAGMKKKRKKRKEATFVKVEKTLNLQGEKVIAKWMIMFPRVNLVCENVLCNNPDSHVCCTLPICQTYFLKVKPNTDPCSVARCCYFRNILRKNVGDKTLFWRQDASCGFSMHFLQNTQSHWFIYNLICVFFLLNTNVSTCTA